MKILINPVKTYLESRPFKTCRFTHFALRLYAKIFKKRLAARSLFGSWTIRNDAVCTEWRLSIPIWFDRIFMDGKDNIIPADDGPCPKGCWRNGDRCLARSTNEEFAYAFCERYCEMKRNCLVCRWLDTDRTDEDHLGKQNWVYHYIQHSVLNQIFHAIIYQ